MSLPDRPGIALALGGGAALGWGHIGALRALEAAGVPIAAVAGTSIGAIAAACLAAGKLDLLEEIARGAGIRRILSYLDPHFTRGAVLGGRKVARELSEHLGDARFEALSMPCCAVAADLETGEEVRLCSGEVASAVQASISIPGLFQPVARDGRRLVDGGMVANLPIGAARALAPGRPLVVIDLMGDYRGHAEAHPPGAKRPSALQVARSSFLMMIARQQQLTTALERPEVVVTLPTGRHSTGSFHQGEELIAIGEAATAAALPQIRAALSLPTK